MFCKQCGNELINTLGKCQKCGTTVGKGGRFCENCGKKIINPKEPCVCKKNEPVPEIKKEVVDNAWICSCGAKSTGNFCQNCGNKKNNVAASNLQKSNVTQEDNQVPVETPRVTQNSQPVKNIAVSKPVEAVKKAVNQPKQFKNPVFAKIAAQSKENNTAADDVLKETAIKLVYGKEAAEGFKNKPVNTSDNQNEKIAEPVKSDIVKTSNNNQNEVKKSNPINIKTPLCKEKQPDTTKHNVESHKNADNAQDNVNKEPLLSESIKTPTAVVSGVSAEIIQNDAKVGQSKKTEQGKKIPEDMFDGNNNNSNKPDISSVYPVLNREKEVNKPDFKKTAEYENMLKPNTITKEKPFIDTFWVAGLFLGLLGMISFLLKKPTLYSVCSISAASVFSVLDIIIGKKKYGIAVLLAIMFASLIFILMPNILK